MRQAGRYQPEYREIRKKHSLLDICRQPALCAEVTLLPVEQLDTDAAILFSDITLPLGPMGIPFDIVENVGPIIETPIRLANDVERIRDFNGAESLPEVGQTIKILAHELTVPLIGFIGAPFTLASYLVEGGPSKNFIKVKSFMYNQPEAWNVLMTRLTKNLAEYCRYQVKNGCNAIQVFDSWVGQLDQADYDSYVYPYMEILFAALKDLNVPLIHFGIINGHLLERMRDCGATVVGLDWRTSIADGHSRLGTKTAIQGNLDPTSLFGLWETIKGKTDSILDQVTFPGFIFNLGHGILPG
ncbi:MAG: uroporphyrinogen decarboxylase, partial [Bacteroidota bacterium]|nr:uroporphyrinogen decarboxylase [Bacteroidota bacterium]